jgi:hypothetical protein
MREVIAGIVVLVWLVLIPGSAFAYWVPDPYGPGIGPGAGRGLPDGDNLGGIPGLPRLGNILSGIFGNPGNPYAPVYGLSIVDIMAYLTRLFKE